MSRERFDDQDERTGAGTDTVPWARTDKGRFRKGTSGNPKGRPRKRQKEPDNVLLRVLGGYLPAGSGGLKRRMTFAEGIARTVVAQGLRNSRDGLRILEFALKAWDAEVETADAEVLPDCEAILSAHLERKKRQWERTRRDEPDATDVGLSNGDDDE